MIREEIINAIVDIPFPNDRNWYHVRNKAAKYYNGVVGGPTGAIDHEMLMMLHLGEILMDKDRVLSLPEKPKTWEHGSLGKTTVRPSGPPNYTDWDFGPAGYMPTGGATLDDPLGKYAHPIRGRVLHRKTKIGELTNVEMIPFCEVCMESIDSKGQHVR